MRHFWPLLSFAVIAAACGGDKSITGPDDPACVKARIGSGDVRTGRLGGASCSFRDAVWLGDSTFYDSYTVQVTAGKAYQFTVRAPNDTTDYVLELMGTGSSAGQEELLAVADDEGGGYDPQMYFIAPESGVYSLRVMGYSLADTSAYTLSARECAARATVVTTFSANDQRLQSSDCVWGAPYFSPDSAHVALYTIQMDSNTHRSITVTSSDFTPALFVAGPGFDALCHLQTCAGAAIAYGGDSVTTLLEAGRTGGYTLAVGTTSYTGGGTFTLRVGAAGQTGPAPIRRTFDATRASKHRPR